MGLGGVDVNVQMQNVYSSREGQNRKLVSIVLFKLYNRKRQNYTVFVHIYIYIYSNSNGKYLNMDKYMLLSLF